MLKAGDAHPRLQAPLDNHLLQRGVRMGEQNQAMRHIPAAHAPAISAPMLLAHEHAQVLETSGLTQHYRLEKAVGQGVGEDRLNSDGKWEGDNRKVFHSFRSTLIAALRTANVPKDRRTRLAGHDYDDTQDKHYTGGDVLTMFDFKTLKADIECVKFDVDFAPYQRAGAGITSLEGGW